MNNDIQIINVNGIDCYEKDGIAYLKLEAIARGLGFTQTQVKEGIEYESIRWERVGKYLSEIGFPHKWGKDSYIPESVFYRLAMKAKNDVAEAFQAKIAEEVIPSIRKHGAYMTPETLQEVLCNPDALFQIVSALKEESDKRKALEIQNSALAVDLAIAQPKADYFDDCIARGGLMNFRDTAKLLGMRQKEFIDNLLRDSYLYRDKRGRLLPYQKRNNGYLEVKEAFNNSSDWNGVQTLVTPKGREFFRSLYPSV